MRYHHIRQVFGSRISSLQKTISGSCRQGTKRKLSRDNTAMYFPAEGFRKFYYRDCNVQLKEDGAECKPELTACTFLGTQNKNITAGS
jgi:hypothetical protein